MRGLDNLKNKSARENPEGTNPGESLEQAIKTTGLLCGASEKVFGSFPVNDRVFAYALASVLTLTAAGCASGPGERSDSDAAGDVQSPSRVLLSAVADEMPTNATGWTGAVADGALGYAALAAGPLGFAGKCALDLARDADNGKKASAAMEQLKAAITAGEGMIKHEGSEHRAEYSVEHLQLKDPRYQTALAEVGNGSAIIWNELTGNAKSNFVSPSAANILGAVNQNVIHLTHTPEGQYANDLLSYAKRRGEAYYMTQSGEFYIVKFQNDLPVVVSEYAGGVEN